MRDPEDRIPFAEALYVVAETMRATLSPVAVEGYFAALAPALSLAQVRIACDRALRECEFMPRPKELLALARPAPVLPYHLPWTDPVKLLAAPHPRETWPAKEGK